MAKVSSKKASSVSVPAGLSGAQIESAIKMLKVLAGEVRFNVANLLAGTTEMCVSDICIKLNLPQPLVSNHLGMLNMVGAVSSRRDKQRIFYSIEPKLKALISAIGSYVA